MSTHHLCFKAKIKNKNAFMNENEPSHEKINNSHMRKQGLCFRHTDSTIPLLHNIQSFKLLALFCDCTAWFVSHLVGNPSCWFSHAQAQIVYVIGVEHWKQWLNPDMIEKLLSRTINHDTNN